MPVRRPFATLIDSRGIGATLDDIPKVMCAVCKKPVERIAWETRYDTMTSMVRVWCHGDVDTCEIPDEIMIDGTLEPGWAFTTKRVADSAVAGINSALIGPDQPDK